MKFISYAQNAEDVMLWRALGHIEAGFYIDVGANHPADDSVTKAFYDRGWSGINIEPLAKHIRELERDRPRDINLQLAVGAHDGEIELFDTPVRGLATVSAEMADRHAAQGLHTVRSVVPIRRLDAICSDYAPADIHFLKIDVEGFEAEVLAGMDFKRFRPWVVVIEATLPNSREISAAWEPSFLEQGYQLTYFDGLNRYYLAKEHVQSLSPHFQSPPNVFDEFVTIELVQTRQKAEDLNARLQVTHKQLAVVQEDLTLAGQRLGDLERQWQALQSSWSWRITAPLRWALQQAKRLRRALRPRTTAGDVLSGQRLATVVKDTHGHWPRPNASSLPLFPRRPEAASLKAAGLQTVRFRIVGHIEGHYSLAMVNRGLALGLEALNPGHTGFQPVHVEPYDQPSDLPDSEAALLRELIARRSAIEGDDVVSIAHHYPIVTDAAPASMRLIFFFWEENLVPWNTVARLNDSFDGVLVASDFVRRALIDSGCRRPVFVVPLGVDHLIPHTKSDPADLRPKPGARFRFLHVSSVFERKGPDTLLQAYFSAFNGGDPVELYIKTFPNPHNRIAEQLQALSVARDNPPKVILDQSTLDAAGLLALYQSAQAMVLPTRGEGFNLPAAEALALGLPLVVTGYGAHLDFVNLQNALLIPYRFAPSQSHLKSTGSCWVDANPVSLARLLRQVQSEVLDSSADLAVRRTLGAQQVSAVYTWRNCAAAVQGSVDWLRTATPLGPSRKLTLVGPWQTRCGVAEYTQKLLAAVSANGDWQLRVFCDDRTPGNLEQTVFEPTWRLGDVASVETTLDRVFAQVPDVLLVQHQPSLFVLTPRVCDRLVELSALGCVVLLELHSTQPLLAEHRLCARSIAALRRLDRILVHQADDLNQLLALGLSENVTLFPLGVAQAPPADHQRPSRATLGVPDDALVIGSFGFALPHKGVDRLLAAIEPLAKATGRPVHVLGIHSILDWRSEQTLQGWQQYASMQGLDTSVTWVTDYRPIEDCLAMLELADYVIFPYRETQESASAAVTVGLATRKPVLVSPLDIFGDVADCAYQMTGAEAHDIVSAVMSLETDRARVQGLLDRQRVWLAERDWQRVSAKLFGMLDGLQWQRRVQAVTRPMPSPVDQRPRRLFVDISELYFRDARTGIQRVVRSVLNELFAEPPPGYDICPVFAEKGQQWRHTSRHAPTGAPAHQYTEGQTIVPRPGDIFYGVDLSAHLFPEGEEFLQGLRLTGVRIFFVVHDIIPLRMPTFTVPGMTDAFAAWLQALARQADGLVCVSSAVADDVRCWLSENQMPLPYPDIRFLHHGADIGRSSPTHGRPPDADVVLAALAGAPAFLSVSTIEPRKGQDQTLAAFELLWASGVQARLVFVGKEGWMMESFVDRLRHHPERGRRLFWLEGISDEFLQEVYASSDCLIAASHAEGFGLPLIEAASQGLLIMARDIPVFREVAGHSAFYFSGNRAQDMERALRRWLDLYARGDAPTSKGMQWLTWRESVAQLKDLLLEDVN